MSIKMDKKNYVMHTYSPGFQYADPGLDPNFQIQLTAKKEGKLRDLHRDEPRINHSAYNYHEMDDWMTPDHKKIKPQVLIEKFSVPLMVEGSDGEMVENREGVIILESAEDVITLWKALIPLGDTRVKLNTMFGKDLTPEEKARIFEDSFTGFSKKEKESDDISKRKMPKQGS